jgi:rubredoxin
VGAQAMTTDALTTDAMTEGTHRRMECKVCWYVYDPAAGDPVWQIAPGTPFAALPEHWTCPNCSTEKQGFLELGEDA